MTKPKPETPEAASVSEVQMPLQDIVLSNSWALQAILDYLEEEKPGARDRIWEKYQVMKAMVEADNTDVKPS